MTYYKIIQNNEFIGIGTSYELRKYLPKHNILLVANDNTAQYIDINGKLYRDNWLKIINDNDAVSYETANISVISEEEYQQLFETIDKGEEIQVVTEQENLIQEAEQLEQQIPIEEIVTIDYLKEQKIKEMSYVCNQIITDGFDIVLSDNKIYHFSLTVQDQLNLITLSAMITNGETEIPYHADAELCRIYSAEDINNIIRYATEFKMYHTTYFNSLKAYIQSLKSREDIGNINYGINIPEEYQSDVLKSILLNRNNTQIESDNNENIT